MAQQIIPLNHHIISLHILSDDIEIHGLAQISEQAQRTSRAIIQMPKMIPPGGEVT